MLRSLLLSSVILLSACATAMEGTSQSLMVVTNPPGADCVVERNGARIGQVNPTPGSTHFDKSKNDLAIRCQKPNYQAATVAISPKFQGTTFGNVLIGGLVGVAVDMASGANYAYPTDVNIIMAPEEKPGYQPSLAPTS